MTIQNLILALIIIAFTSCKEEDKNNGSKDAGMAEVSEQNENKKGYDVVVPDLGVPWGFEFLPDGSMLIGEQKGELIHFKDGQKTKVEGLPEVYFRGQGGLMDIYLHPKYTENGWIYFSYSSPAGEDKGGNTAIMRAKLEGSNLVEQQVLYKAVPNTTRGQHFGSRILIDDNGYLFFTIGERGNRDENPQDITRDGGKVYRLMDDGSIPTDNPFYNSPKAKQAIYSYGHRNPQGMDFHPSTKEIWTHEHGPRGGDEINIVKKGANYGWPVISYGINYSGSKFTEKTSEPGMEQPLHYWDPSIAPSGMAFITSDKYPNWKGKLLIGSLKFQYVDLISLDGQEVTKEEKLLEGIGRIRTINQGPDGYIYIGVENLGIIKLLPQP